MTDHIDAERLELWIERTLDAPVAAVWRAWTEHLEAWWCPKPWSTELVEMDLRPGGRSAMIMRGPNGEGGEVMEGIILEASPEHRIVFTNVVDSAWRPQVNSTMNIVGWFEFEPDGQRTRYRAGARHWDADSMAKHQAMGFHQGWNAVADQLEAVAQGLRDHA
jgi:uncharacterized protein YndB with AHSA1/START domain